VTDLQKVLKTSRFVMDVIQLMSTWVFTLKPVGGPYVAPAFIFNQLARPPLGKTNFSPADGNSPSEWISACMMCSGTNQMTQEVFRITGHTN
jgi:hypothetical protein